MRYIYLSPHLDDAALSAGGWIYEQTQSGNPVEIWTLMSGFPQIKELSPFAQMLHTQWGMDSAEEVIRGRRQEDINAANILGATVQHFDFLDCIYRKNKDNEWLYPEVFKEPHPDEADFPKQIADEITRRLKPDDKLICQFSIGKHVDHILVRRAAEFLGKPLLYVADIPYLFRSPEQLNPHIVGMKNKVEVVSEAGVRSWVEAVKTYESQIAYLFESHEAMQNQIHEYCLTNGGVRFWFV
jgi:LmbE family N-acetylglucosaminyl deacetylase